MNEILLGCLVAAALLVILALHFYWRRRSLNDRQEIVAAYSRGAAFSISAQVKTSKDILRRLTPKSDGQMLTPVWDSLGSVDF